MNAILKANKYLHMLQVSVHRQTSMHMFTHKVYVTHRAPNQVMSKAWLQSSNSSLFFFCLPLGESPHAVLKAEDALKSQIRLLLSVTAAAQSPKSENCIGAGGTVEVNLALGGCSQLLSKCFNLMPTGNSHILNQFEFPLFLDIYSIRLILQLCTFQENLKKRKKRKPNCNNMIIINDSTGNS